MLDRAGEGAGATLSNAPVAAKTMYAGTAVLRTASKRPETSAPARTPRSATAATAESASGAEKS